MPAPKLTQAVQMQRRRHIAMGGTFLVAVALAVQLGQRGALADDNLVITGPVVFLGAILSGWVLRPSAALSMALAATAVLSTLAISQTGSAYTDELLLFAIPFSAMAAIVVGHCRRWPGRTAGMMAVVLCALAIGVGMTESPAPFTVFHLAMLVALPTIPFPSDPLPSTN
ncbi:MAG: hypothetical protein GY811_01750 [Myxococcales bacterium]|nr:hypothetical protein [Myxococcales bacterium]